jgi:signal transduction histidine kinase
MQPRQRPRPRHWLFGPQPYQRLLYLLLGLPLGLLYLLGLLGGLLLAGALAFFGGNWLGWWLWQAWRWANFERQLALLLVGVEIAIPPLATELDPSSDPSSDPSPDPRRLLERTVFWQGLAFLLARALLTGPISLLLGMGLWLGLILLTMPLHGGGPFNMTGGPPTLLSSLLGLLLLVMLARGGHWLAPRLAELARFALTDRQNAALGQRQRLEALALAAQLTTMASSLGPAAPFVPLLSQVLAASQAAVGASRAVLLVPAWPAGLKTSQHNDDLPPSLLYHWPGLLAALQHGRWPPHWQQSSFAGGVILRPKPGATQKPAQKPLQRDSNDPLATSLANTLANQQALVLIALVNEGSAAPAITDISANSASMPSIPTHLLVTWSADAPTELVTLAVMPSAMPSTMPSTMPSAMPALLRPSDLAFLASIGQQIGVALAQARLIASVQRQAASQAALAERHKLARELHDSVSQALYGIALGARTAQTLLERDPSQAHAPLEYVLQLAEASVSEMRALIFELRPEDLATNGLVAALQRQAEMLRLRYQLQVETDFGAAEASGPAQAATPLSLGEQQSLLRIAQEALHNTVKHARAGRVWLRWRDGLLEVRDDGKGFWPEATVAAGLGQRTMRERALALGASFSLHSSPGEGTCIRVQLPNS